MSPELHLPSQDHVNAAVWAAGESFRGSLDLQEYKKHLLSFFFFKYITDAKAAGLLSEITIPEKCGYDYVKAHKHNADLGSLINKAMERTAAENEWIRDIFSNLDFSSEKLGALKERNRRLRKLIADFSKKQLDFNSFLTHDRQIISRAWTYLLERFATNAGKKGGEYYTPEEVNELLARLMMPKPGDTICDPAFGSASLLAATAMQIPHAKNETPDTLVFGQELEHDNFDTGRMNLIIHGIPSRTELGDVIRKPALIAEDALMKFDIIVSNPPFSYEHFNMKEAAKDNFHRFNRGIPPSTKGNYAFILHILETLTPEKGRAGVVVPHGVLFRLGSEKTIRENIVKENLLEAVIGLPANLFFGTGISAAILIFNTTKESKDILFIDAGKESENGKKQSRMRQQHIDKIVDTYDGFLAGGGSMDKYSRRASIYEIEKNDFNLSISRYVDTAEKKKKADIYSIQRRMEELEKEMSRAKSEMNRYLKELEF
jgi:type I restriction enzyme M protein